MSEQQEPSSGQPSSAYWLLRGFVTTFLSVFIAAVPIESVAAGDLSWWKSAALAAGSAAIKAVINALDSSFPLYGRGSDGV